MLLGSASLAYPLQSTPPSQVRTKHLAEKSQDAWSKSMLQGSAAQPAPNTICVNLRWMGGKAEYMQAGEAQAAIPDPGRQFQAHACSSISISCCMAATACLMVLHSENVWGCAYA